MPNTYTKLHLQFVFAVKYRAALINKEWKEDLHQYITGIFQQNDHKMLQINSMPDHIHIFIGMRPHQSISALVQNVKTEIVNRLTLKNSVGVHSVGRIVMVHFPIRKVTYRM